MFDQFGQPVASLNIKGRQTYTTNLGGILGILIYATIGYFVRSRLIKLVNQADPYIFEVNQGLNLMRYNDEFRF